MTNRSANGIRTSKTVNSVKHSYILDGTKILREAWGKCTIVEDTSQYGIATINPFSFLL